jgi:hypothetical protein
MSCSDSDSRITEESEKSRIPVPSTPPTLKGLKLGMYRRDVISVLEALAKECYDRKNPDIRGEVVIPKNRKEYLKISVNQNTVVEVKLGAGGQGVERIEFRLNYWRNVAGPYDVKDMSMSEFAEGLQSALGLPTFEWMGTIDSRFPVYYLSFDPPYPLAGWQLQIESALSQATPSSDVHIIKLWSTYNKKPKDPSAKFK